MSEPKTAETSRRDFLKVVAAGAPAAAAAAIAAPAEAAVEPEQTVGLRKTEHVERYLESARF